MKRSASLALLILLVPFAYVTAWSQGSGNSEPLRCVRLSLIDRTEVIDDRTIAFFMRGGDIYINHLNRVCTNLYREKRFSYRTQTSQLCSSDYISVLENVGIGLSRGASCGLEYFVPSDEEEIAVLKGEDLEAEVTVEEIDLEE
jgi:hypothetical protein